uniref:NACHT, LRR and PYD domains-containing protein 3 n=1 Tax=Athene cunicularia TaxID=194338 RepID=A0A663M238_ATHCN
MFSPNLVSPSQARGRALAGCQGSPHGVVRQQGEQQSTAGDLLLQALEDLSKINFKKFWHALAYGDLQGRNRIPWGRLEKADWIDTTNLMMNSYGREDALDVAIIVFKHIQLREAAYQLQEKREKGSAPLVDSSSPGSCWRGEAGEGPAAVRPVVCRCMKRPPTLPDYQRDYKKAICQAYSHIKDQNARVGDSVSLESRYLKLVIVNKHRDEEHEIMAMGQRHAEIMKEQAQASSSITVDDLFDPGPDGWTPKVLVLVGAAGMGKTMTARKIMLDWASDKVFAKFDYVFYIHCREGNLLTREASMAELITQCCPSGSLPLDKVLEQPEKLLFVIDGFDELRISFHLPEPELCSQPKEKSLVEITLSSLFRRRFVPESSLLITTRLAALQKLSRFLKCERYAEIVGFSEVERKEYFYKFFNNAEQAAAVFQFVRGNEVLFTMCLVPIMCWIVCTVMKKQFSSTRGLAQSPKTMTGIYILYLSALLQSLRGWLKPDVPAVLRSLCCLAVDGVWKQKVLFEEKEVHGYVLDQRQALPLLLSEHVFQRDISCVSTYSFIHLSFQEFFAVLFYLLEDEGEVQDLPAGPSRDVKNLLESYSNSSNYLVLTVRFLFGLLNEDRRRELEEKTGCKIAPRITQELLAWLQNSQKTPLALLLQEPAVIHELEICHCLYETQDEGLVVTALDSFMGVNLRGLNLNRFDQMVLSFSVKNFPKLESLDLGNCSFLRDDPEDSLEKSGFREGLAGASLRLWGSSPHLSCRFGQCQLTGACCGALATVLSVKSTLTELDLAGNEDLRDGGVKLLCEGLRCGACLLQTLRLGCCNLTAAGCRDLAAVLGAMPSLAPPDLSDNPVEDGGVRALCRALAGPGCGIQKLWQCRVTEGSCGALAEVLPVCPSLRELHLGVNELGDGGVWQLSEGLQDPACRLQMLSCCYSIHQISALSTSQSLEHLDLSENDLGDGGVWLLCESLGHPTCCPNAPSLQIFIHYPWFIHCDSYTVFVSSWSFHASLLPSPF